MKRVLTMACAGEEMEVVCVSHGQEALNHAQHHHPDLILANVLMADMDVYDFAKQLLNDSVLAKIPMVVLASQHRPYDTARGGELNNIRDVISKPFETQAFLSKIYRVANRRLSSPGSLIPEPMDPSDTRVSPAPAFSGSSAVISGRPSSMPPGQHAFSTSAAPGLRSRAPSVPPPPRAAMRSDAALEDPAAVSLRKTSAERPSVRVPYPTPPASMDDAAKTQEIARGRSSAPRVQSNSGIPGPHEVPTMNLRNPPLRATLPQSTPPASAVPVAPKASSTPPLASVPTRLATQSAAGSSEFRVTREHPPAADNATATHANARLSSAPTVTTRQGSSAGTRTLPERLQALGLTRAQVEGVLVLSREVIEQVVWDVVPELAETMIREEIQRLSGEN